MNNTQDFIKMLKSIGIDALTSLTNEEDAAIKWIRSKTECFAMFGTTNNFFGTKNINCFCFYDSFSIWFKFYSDASKVLEEFGKFKYKLIDSNLFDTVISQFKEDALKVDVKRKRKSKIK